MKSSIFCNMDGPRNCHAKWSQSDNETPTWNAFTDMWNLKKDTMNFFAEQILILKILLFPKERVWCVHNIASRLLFCVISDFAIGQLLPWIIICCFSTTSEKKTFSYQIRLLQKTEHVLSSLHATENLCKHLMHTEDLAGGRNITCIWRAE